MTKPSFVLFILLFSYNTLLSQDETNPDSGVELADRHLEELQKYYAEGNYQLHKAHSDSLLSVAIEHSLSKMHVFALVNQAVFHNNRNERLKAIELYHEALEQCKLIPKDIRAKIVVLVNMGNTYNNIGLYDKAISIMKKVLVVADSTENSGKVKAAALLGLANNYAELEDHEKTLEYANKAKIIGENTQNNSVIAASLNNIIDAHVQMEAYEKALAISDKALKLSSPEKPTKSRGWLLLNIGIANYHLDQQETALKYLIESRTLAKEKELFQIEMYVYEYLAKVYEHKEDYKASFASQKEYSLLRDKFLLDKKDASTVDLEKDIISKDKTINENKVALSEVENKRIRFIIWGSALVVVLSSLLFFYVKRKKAIEEEQTKLRAQYTRLRQTILEEETRPLDTTKDSVLKPYDNSSLTEEKRYLFKKKILTHMNEEKPFLNPDLNQSDLASSIGISTHHFSEVLHYGFEQNFYNFMNSYRVIEAQKLIKDSKYRDSKIIAIAFDSGFKSKTSFNRVFKQHVGMTPSEFRQTSRD